MESGDMGGTYRNGRAQEDLREFFGERIEIMRSVAAGSF
jgi:hypothetical protein